MSVSPSGKRALSPAAVSREGLAKGPVEEAGSAAAVQGVATRLPPGRIAVRVIWRHCFIRHKIQTEQQGHKYPRPGSCWTVRGPRSPSRGDACSPGPGQAELGLGEAERCVQSPEQERAWGGSRGPCHGLCSVPSQASLLPRRSRKIHGLKNQFRLKPGAWAGPAGQRVGSFGGGVGGLHKAGAPLRVTARQRGPSGGRRQSL